jgi:hypothetical protein
MPTPDIQYPVFQPAMRVITAITNTLPAVVTTNLNHQYVNGMTVRLNVPRGFGMVQANQKQGIITVTGPTTFTLPIDATNFDIFAAPTKFPANKQSAVVTPIGEINSMLSAATKNVLPY